MSSTTIALTADHLGAHRRFLVTRALAAGLVGLVPVPVLDEWLVAAVRRRTVKTLAEARAVDLTEEAVHALADGTEPPPSWKAVLLSTATGALFRRALRKLVIAFAVGRRVEEIGRTFAVFTLFDHYASRHHVGAGLDAERARRVREAIDEAIRKTPRGLATRIVRRALAAGGKAILRAPLEIVNIASGGLVTRLLARKDEAAAEELVEAAVERAAAAPASFLGRAAHVLEHELADAGRIYVYDLIGAFERVAPRLRRARAGTQS